MRERNNSPYFVTLHNSSTLQHKLAIPCLHQLNPIQGKIFLKIKLVELLENGENK